MPLLVAIATGANGRFWPSISREGRSVPSASRAIRLGLTIDHLADLSFIHPSASETMIRVFQHHSLGEGTKDQNESRVEIGLQKAFY